MESYENGTYDKEYFNTLPIFGKYKYIKGMIDTVISNMHNKGGLDNRFEYHIYSDGTIKIHDNIIGESSIRAYECIKPNTFFTFPCKGVEDGETYAILSETDCIKIRSLINELFLQC